VQTRLVQRRGTARSTCSTLVTTYVSTLRELGRPTSYAPAMPRSSDLRYRTTRYKITVIVNHNIRRDEQRSERQSRTGVGLGRKRSLEKSRAGLLTEKYRFMFTSDRSLKPETVARLRRTRKQSRCIHDYHFFHLDTPSASLGTERLLFLFERVCRGLQ
jgi:hypothetical protein